ncbi:MAG: hypothetical protein A2015_13655 [Spirochaetes bacterium GWF1_31_7]|nr:MAG: hypothetical protein A2Y30_11170 [Spirochaetes bacterium GWE1_32_154]OHD47716.1 MAG: hypothetical protein A2Y29_05140 [Spirochaetes bacterium GWE2_31_10]OHD49865.1 MAG: hypothetical protein A2015_13655 [Spirochaetes bacterium GWF1_31_7]OHD82153.1 MAG: hypothetical protein A2355_13735 [Spirochaetes bacterium RIFOXYB1_FULL_32_8]HBD92886.1 hypothetical protein [Spirochaetia bacterium]
MVYKKFFKLRALPGGVLFFIFFATTLYRVNTIDQQLLADQVQVLLIQSYGRLSNLSPIEKIVIEMGRATFVDNVRIWRLYYNDISLIPIKLHPQIKKVSNIIHKYGDESEAFLFDVYLKELTFLGYRNIDYYYQALLAMDSLKDTNISLEDIEYAVSSPQFYKKKIELFEREAVLKKEIRLIMNSEKLKRRLGIYIFFYDFLNKIRDKIIASDLEYSHKRLMKK